MTGSRVLLFKSRRTRRDVTELTGRLGVRVMDMPMEHESLTQVLHQVMA